MAAKHRNYTKVPLNSVDLCRANYLLKWKEWNLYSYRSEVKNLPSIENTFCISPYCTFCRLLKFNLAVQLLLIKHLNSSRCFIALLIEIITREVYYWRLYCLPIQQCLHISLWHVYQGTHWHLYYMVLLQAFESGGLSINWLFTSWLNMVTNLLGIICNRLTLFWHQRSSNCGNI